MKKHLIYAITALATLTMYSCSEGNSPTPTTEKSVPELARELMQGKIETAKSTLQKRGFIAYDEGKFENSEDTLQYKFAYPATFFDNINEINNKEWIDLTFLAKKNEKPFYFDGNQHFLSSYSAFTTFKEWMNRMPQLIPNPSLHVIYVEEKNGSTYDDFIYRGGSLFDTYKAEKLKQLADAYAQGTITAEEYESRKALLNITKKDLDEKIASLSILQEGWSISEYYVELTDEASYKGMITMNVYYNSSMRGYLDIAPDVAIPTKTIITHAVMVNSEEIEAVVTSALSEEYDH